MLMLSEDISINLQVFWVKIFSINYVAFQKFSTVVFRKYLSYAISDYFAITFAELKYAFLFSNDGNVAT